ncbi:interferon-induced protein 44 [Patella vulgata]|uniref:interferon-induced protein 44 n=1 Tax=Patella vulgata TaxID=6465 RepID=UPI0021808E37|nr:interferon-induced protein 44 [Patella vulgata]XP_055956813.1 interferon-induced protein 44 [Patella vulgata]
MAVKEAQLNNTYLAQFCKWMGRSFDFKLLYRASTDGMGPTIFHQKCDNKGPTVIISYNTDGCVFGGYTSVDWKSCTCGNTSSRFDQKAFLFRLEYMNKFSPKRFIIKRPELAISQGANYGPIFGQVNVQDMMILPHVTVFPTANGNFPTGLTPQNFTFGRVYDNGGVTMQEVTNDNYTFKDVEIYQVMDPVRLDKPWRDDKKEKKATLKKMVEDYCPVEDTGVKQSRILLVGSVGAGKSSYFNTINSIFRGHVTCQASTGSSEHSLTTIYRCHQLRNDSSYLKFRLCDTRGLEDTQGIDPGDLTAMLDGHVPDRYTFNPFSPITPDSPGYIKTPTVKDKIHCVAFVIDSTSVEVMNESVLSKFKLIQKLANQRGIPQVIVLTKVDQIELDVEEDLTQLLYSSRVAYVVDQVAQLIGLPRGHVLPVKNYEKETELNETVDRFALLSLQQMLRFADDYMYELLDA